MTPGNTLPQSPDSTCQVRVPPDEYLQRLRDLPRGQEATAGSTLVQSWTRWSSFEPTLTRPLARALRAAVNLISMRIDMRIVIRVWLAISGRRERAQGTGARSYPCRSAVLRGHHQDPAILRDLRVNYCGRVTGAGRDHPLSARRD